ncbi:protein of unknown function [Cardinium endosymbiont cEper1 of Encarsia pergandiella]|nr:protein of unknown function [Cardinium endosymbiont cEper1 of Encarsia pergandiella]
MLIIIQLKTHLHAYLMAYNFAKRLKALKGKTPWKAILDTWEKIQNILILIQTISYWD